MTTISKNPALMPTRGVLAAPFVLVAPMSDNFADLIIQERDLMSLFNTPDAPGRDWLVLSELYRVLFDEFAAAGALHAAKRCSAYSMRSAQKVRA